MKKFLICAMSLFLVLGFTSLASAWSNPAWDTDSASDSLRSDYDIQRAKVLMYPYTECDAGSPCNDDSDCVAKGDGTTCNVINEVPTYFNLGLEMDAKLPGAVLMDIDLDNNVATGGSSGMVALFPACEGTAPIKDGLPGVDISIFLALDKQDVTAPTAWCDDCFGPSGRCFYKETPCTTPLCGTADCYKGEGECKFLDTNCYVTTGPCQPSGEPTCDECFEMAGPCIPDTPCEYPRIRGEWYANTLTSNNPAGNYQQMPPFHARGRVEMPLPPQGGPNATENEMCITLPWKRMVDILKYSNDGSGTSSDYNGDFDYDAAKDPANYNWALGVGEDGDPNGNDYLNPGPPAICMEIVDAIPNSGTLPGNVGTHGCRGDYTQDGQVTGADTGGYKYDYNRTPFLGAPCPNCLD